ncbi:MULTISPECIES: helix-turn-helix domain-containing protein [Jeotgalicoccus]|uniref:DNA-binding XRE family transcriptional regulator n=1 Tax=Jeotgalicoccus halotolerans TaxID=157227 RepID=A0A3E0AZW9_9STAP|nr:MULTISPECIES: helix-turn-helix transcriptional regulator [Jeotgalicoccus]REG25267.1 DNA-binding XRE family transcriptional regulator [Jeotgalicoccus halotolerans]
MKKFYQLYIARNEAGESTADVGKLIGLSKASYWNRENAITNFDLAEAFILAQHYGKTIEELFPEMVHMLQKKEVS